MSEFTLFLDLPPELQHQIWDLAIRDEGPAAHFFTLYDPAADPDDVVRPEKRVHATSGEKKDPSYRVGLAAPQGRGSSEPSWTGGNVSAYMTDSGLWTACVESRKRMLWHFRPAATSCSQRVSDPAHGTRPSCTAPVTMRFRRENGERQYLTVRPSEDLLCFQFAKGSGIYRQESEHWSHLREFPLFRWRHSPQAPERVRHAAIEWDEEVFNGPSMEWFRHSLLKADEMAGLAGFWFINYGLERRYRADGDRRARKTFQAAGGVDFVEVLKGDDEWFERPNWVKGTGSCRIEFYTAQALNFFKKKTISDMFEDGDDMRDNIDDEESVGFNEGSDDRADGRRPRIRYGILACVKPGSEKHLPTKSEWIDASDASKKICAGMRSMTMEHASSS